MFQSNLRRCMNVSIFSNGMKLERRKINKAVTVWTNFDKYCSLWYAFQCHGMYINKVTFEMFHMSFTSIRWNYIKTLCNVILWNAFCWVMNVIFQIKKTIESYLSNSQRRFSINVQSGIKVGPCGCSGALTEVISEFLDDRNLKERGKIV